MAADAREGGQAALQALTWLNGVWLDHAVCISLYVPAPAYLHSGLVGHSDLEEGGCRIYWEIVPGETQYQGWSWIQEPAAIRKRTADREGFWDGLGALATLQRSCDTLTTAVPCCRPIRSSI